jgi:hypothetical protein
VCSRRGGAADRRDGGLLRATDVCAEICVGVDPPHASRTTSRRVNDLTHDGADLGGTNHIRGARYVRRSSGSGEWVRRDHYV